MCMYFSSILPMAKKSIQIRLDEKLKKRVEQIFEAVGIDTPTAVRSFFTSVVEFGGIPFMLVSRKDQCDKTRNSDLGQMVKDTQ